MVTSRYRILRSPARGGGKSQVTSLKSQVTSLKSEISEESFTDFLSALKSLDYTGYAEQYPPFGSWEDVSARRVNVRSVWLKSLKCSDETGLFVNIPFCKIRCRFCFLPVSAVGASGPARIESFRRFFSALERECSFFSPVFKKTKIPSVYIGGGTPSLMEPDEIKTFFNLLNRYFKIAPDAQIVLEIHPDDAGHDKISAFKSCGVNRICIGAQSLDKKVLSANYRRQRLDSVIKAYEACKECGINGINIDLICGLPGQNRKSFLTDLKNIAALRPDQLHLNTFINTPYTLHALAGGKGPDERLVESIRQEGFALLKNAGYIRIDSDSMGLTPDSRNIQTTDLWKKKSMLGLGPGAISHAFSSARHMNYVRWEDYERIVRRRISPVARAVFIGEREEMIYFALTKLTDELSLNLTEFKNIYGVSFKEAFKSQIKVLMKQGAYFVNDDFVLPSNMWCLVRQAFYQKKYLLKLREFSGKLFLEETKD
ncbi:MAG: radical SAM protein [Elusimicrobia bacterium]|nr:radical SAM protein [Elusimicrobiota bacterium]